jgi:hypothetical protein
MYPVMAAAVSDHVGPNVRGAAIGIYRWWRDLGCAAGSRHKGLTQNQI